MGDYYRGYTGGYRDIRRGIISMETVRFTPYPYDGILVTVCVLEPEYSSNFESEAVCICYCQGMQGRKLLSHCF